MVVRVQAIINKVATAQPSIIKVATAQPSIIKVATVSIIIKPTPPIPLYQTATTYQGQPISISLKSSSNPANGVIEYKINSNPNQGKITNFNKNTGQLTYTPNQNAKNFDSFTFSVAYGGQGSGNYQQSSNSSTKHNQSSNSSTKHNQSSNSINNYKTNATNTIISNCNNISRSTNFN